MMLLMLTSLNSADRDGIPLDRMRRAVFDLALQKMGNESRRSRLRLPRWPGWAEENETTKSDRRSDNP